MNAELFISQQDIDRQNILLSIHRIIIETDKSVKAEVEPMMGKEMIVYKDKNLMKYGLASMKNYMSLHVLPIYGSTVLYSKYKALLNRANFQKGCINFGSEDEMPLSIVKQLMADCSVIDLVKIKEQYLKQKTKKPKN